MVNQGLNKFVQGFPIKFDVSLRGGTTKQSFLLPQNLIQ